MDVVFYFIYFFFLISSGCNIKFSPTLAFKDCLQAGLRSHIETVIRISETASKEHSIEQALDKMERDWENVDLDLSPYKETG